MGCLSVNIRDEGRHLQVRCGLANPLLQVKSTLLNQPLQVNCSLVCSVVVLRRYFRTSDNRIFKTRDGKFLQTKK